MKPEQVREIVKMTIDELTSRKLLQVDNYNKILRSVEVNLFNFFDNKACNNVSYALRQLSDDQYIDIIYLQYRDFKTLEWIAEYMDKDVSTIQRNKKRLILKIYDLLE